MIFLKVVRRKYEEDLIKIEFNRNINKYDNNILCYYDTMKINKLGKLLILEFNKNYKMVQSMDIYQGVIFDMIKTFYDVVYIFEQNEIYENHKDNKYLFLDTQKILTREQFLQKNILYKHESLIDAPYLSKKEYDNCSPLKKMIYVEIEFYKILTKII
jgi:hypothetical protein